MTTILALGAERQAATSLALAYPDCTVVFVSDCPILDGADLPNVRMMHGEPAEAGELIESADHVLPLCPRWLREDHSLTRLFGHLDRTFPGRCLPVHSRFSSSGQWIAKGNRWHRPDAPMSGDPPQLADLTDVHGCGLVFQPYVRAQATLMAIGRRERAQAALIGIIKVLQERFFRDVVLQAGETMDNSDVTDASLEVLDQIDHHGFFTLNWLRTDEGLKLSSFRPVPLAIFQTFLRGGVDLLAVPSGTQVVPSGLRFVAQPTYVSYNRLSA